MAFSCKQIQRDDAEESSHPKARVSAQGHKLKLFFRMPKLRFLPGPPYYFPKRVTFCWSMERAKRLCQHSRPATPTRRMRIVEFGFTLFSVTPNSTVRILRVVPQHQPGSG